MVGGDGVVVLVMVGEDGVVVLVMVVKMRW